MPTIAALKGQNAQKFLNQGFQRILIKEQKEPWNYTKKKSP